MFVKLVYKNQYHICNMNDTIVHYMHKILEIIIYIFLQYLHKIQ